ncbi:hypothetical protein LZ31DRAFT_318652 [Colletotrichum somersetense]|nr:hypothetical protein LZ31DRAFT_318652 [Colletotrichum somersetense]
MSRLQPRTSVEQKPTVFLSASNFSCSVIYLRPFSFSSKLYRACQLRNYCCRFRPKTDHVLVICRPSVPSSHCSRPDQKREISRLGLCNPAAPDTPLPCVRSPLSVSVPVASAQTSMSIAHTMYVGTAHVIRRRLTHDGRIHYIMISTRPETLTSYLNSEA